MGNVACSIEEYGRHLVHKLSQKTERWPARKYGVDGSAPVRCSCPPWQGSGITLSGPPGCKRGRGSPVNCQSPHRPSVRRSATLTAFHLPGPSPSKKAISGSVLNHWTSVSASVSSRNIGSQGI